MTDIAQPAAGATSPGRSSVHTSQAAEARLRARYAADRRFRAYGIVAILLALGMLGTLLVTIVSSGLPAFTETTIRLEVPLAEEVVGLAPGTTERTEIRRGDFDDALEAAILVHLPDATEDVREAAGSMFARVAELDLRDRLTAEPGLIGGTVTFEAVAADKIDQIHKGLLDRTLPENRRPVSDEELVVYDALLDQGLVSRSFNWRFFTGADSRSPEGAGIWSAIVGSAMALSVCFIISFPVAIAAAIYLEEFAPKNRWTDLIEVNINNLAAVPSIVFGLLGLAVFIQFFGLPRSAPLVGGMVLSLMTLPTIVIAARASLKAVPPSIREAALGMGASKLQTITHHVLPLAMPGILTGTIIGMAQALGETAPLLLIGMNAFITSAPDSFTSPATALPAQVYMWADHPERGFAAKTSAAIMVLLAFLIMMNATAIMLRKRFERRW